MAIETIIKPNPLTGAASGTTPIAAPFQFYVTGEDALRIRSWSSNAVTLVAEGRWLRMDNSIEVFRYTFQTDGLSNAQEFAIPPREGYLLNCSLRVLTPITLSGQCFTQLLIGRGSGSAYIALGTVLQGYVGTAKFLAFPGSPLEDSFSGPGFPRNVTIDPVGPGVNWDVFVPASRRWRIQSIVGSFQASVSGPNRDMVLMYMFSGILDYVRISTAAPIPPTARYTLSWAPGQAVSAIANTGTMTMPLPDPVFLYGLTHIRPVVLPIDGADQWTQTVMTVDEWLVTDTTPPFTL